MVKIAHCGDIHIKNLERQDEYLVIFNKYYKKLSKFNPDYIFIVGDLVDSFITISNECKVIAGDFLMNLSKIANKKVIVVPGNHDIRKNNLSRFNSAYTIVQTLHNDKIIYYGESGFYEFDEFVIVNYSHIQKEIDPWCDIAIPDCVNTKPTIALYHDPIYSSSTDCGQVFNIEGKHKPITYFDKNDYVMLADIHKQQYMRTDKSAAYCSSLIQQSFGETPNLHGFLTWEIEDKKTFNVKFIEIPNNYNLINFTIGKNFNYDDIQLEDDYIVPTSKIRIIWKDFYANNTNVNEMKIRAYIKDKYEIIDVIFDKNGMIQTNLDNTEILNENIDVLDVNTQRNIFKEYLKINKYDDKIIDNVLNIDDIINDRIVFEVNNGIDFSIDKIILDNFKSYEYDEIDFENLGKNVILQVHGLNTAGKSTILDAICYVLYNKSFGTLKKQKGGDARFINNKKDLDECSVTAILDINGEKYTIKRTTIRKWNKDKSNFTASTTVDYVKGISIEDGECQNEEQRKDTQKLLDETFSDFDSFINKSFINGENLNSLLSMDRSTFIDGLVKDSGFDVFEKKLDEFKIYKKEILDNRKKINLQEVSENIEILTTESNDVNTKLDIINDELKDLEKDKNIIILEKDNKLLSLEKIDPEIEQLDITDIELSIETENQKIEKNNERIVLISKLKIEVDIYDNTILENKTDEYDNLNQTINDIKLEMSNIDNKILTKKNELTILDNEIDNIITNYVNDFTNKNKDLQININKVKEEFNNYLNDYITKINKDISDLIKEKTILSNDISNITKDGKRISKENEELSNSTVCPTCGRKLEIDKCLSIENKIKTNKIEINNLRIQYTEIDNKIKSIENKIDGKNEILNKIKIPDFSFDVDVLDKFNTIKSEIDVYKSKINDNVKNINSIKNKEYSSDLVSLIDIPKNKKEKVGNDIETLKTEKIQIEFNLNTHIITLEEIKLNISSLKIDKENNDKKKEKISLLPRIESEIEKSNMNINIFNKQILEYNNTISKIKNNKKINIEISDLNEKLKVYTIKINIENEDKIGNVSRLEYIKNKIKECHDDIKLYNKQKNEDEILTTYMKCVHRDGLPTFLLKKSINIINRDLENLLYDVNYKIFFDDELELKLSSKNRLDVSQNIIESSGMERTFASLALKIALRKLNNRSKPNILLLDEVMGKLLADSVDLFIQLLDRIKYQVDKLIIIEHNHPINYDCLIEVDKDEKEISHLKIS